MKNTFKLGLAAVILLWFTACDPAKKAPTLADSAATNAKIDSTSKAVAVDSGKTDTTKTDTAKKQLEVVKPL